MIICPKCGTQNAENSKFCTNCSNPIGKYSGTAKKVRLSGSLAKNTSQPDYDTAKSSLHFSDKTHYCSQCGYALPGRDLICPQCGTVHSESSVADSYSVPNSRSVKDRNSAVSHTLPPKKNHRISVFRELILLLEEGISILLGETRNLIISLVFPFGAAAITIWIAGEDMFLNFESTKSACFILVCAAIWGGLFNSIQTIVKERENIKRDYVSGALRIECFTISRALIQMVLCALQAAALCLCFPGVSAIYGNELPQSGVIFNSSMLEFYITIFLITYAADTTGLMISCFVKSEQLASQLSPYFLIVQLLFSGVLFSMEGFASNFSALMLSRWGMEALGSICNLNDLPLKIQLEYDFITHEIDEAFLSTSEHLGEVWLILVVFVVVPLFFGNILLYRVKKDSRD